ELPLCNFNAEIVAEIIRDDGVEQTRRLVLEGTLDTGEPLPPVEVSTEEFARGEWPLTRWGPSAIVAAGQGNKDHLRAAVPSRSGRPPQQIIHVATGWRKIDGVWAYLHAGGAIGPDGPLEGVSV